MNEKNTPFMVAIETNTVCTRTCYYCPRTIEESLVLDSELFYSVINQLKEWGFSGKLVPNGYNEPLTDKRLPEFVAYARYKLPNSIIQINTNGDLLNRKKLENLLSSGVSVLKVSLHEPASQQEEDRLRELAREFKTISVVDLRRASRTKPLSNIGGLVEFRSVVTGTNCYNINAMSIRADGNVALCCQDVKKKYVFGNVKEESVETIWNKKEYIKLREDLNRGEFNIPICQKCGVEKI